MPVARVQLRTVQLLVAVTAVLFALILRGAWLIEDGWLLLVIGVALQVYVAIRQPASSSKADGDGADENPFSPFRRWTWTTPPEHWRHAAGTSLILGLLVFPGLALCVYSLKTTYPQWGYIAFFVLLSVEFTLQSIRIRARVRSMTARSVARKSIGWTEVHPDMPALDDDETESEEALGE